MRKSDRERSGEEAYGSTSSGENRKLEGKRRGYSYTRLISNWVDIFDGVWGEVRWERSDEEPDGESVFRRKEKRKRRGGRESLCPRPQEWIEMAGERKWGKVMESEDRRRMWLIIRSWWRNHRVRQTSFPFPFFPFAIIWGLAGHAGWGIPA